MTAAPLRALVLYARSADTETFSYQSGWPRALARDPRFQSQLVNVAAPGTASRLSAWWAIRHARVDVVLMLHSIFSNALRLDGRLLDAVRALGAPNVFFIGNEYKLMPEKMAFADSLGIALLVSQSNSPAVHRLYRDRLGCAVVGVPNTGVDLEIFRPVSDPDARPIDLGYRADDSPAYLGHNERRRMAEYFQQHAAELGLRVDVSLNPADRLNERDWAAFLNRCRGQLGTEAGGDYFSLDDEYRRTVNAFVAEHPNARFDEIHERFFRGVTAAVPLRIISGRNIEAAATRTVQLLFDGEYDGYFHPDEHYIPLRKDLSNVPEAIEKFRDRGFAARISDNAFRLATTAFTYDALVGRVRDAVGPLVS
jgi:hypothetical protein